MKSVSDGRIGLWEGDWFASEVTRLGGKLPVDALMWIQSKFLEYEDVCHAGINESIVKGRIM